MTYQEVEKTRAIIQALRDTGELTAQSYERLMRATESFIVRDLLTQDEIKRTSDRLYTERRLQHATK